MTIESEIDLALEALANACSIAENGDTADAVKILPVLMEKVKPLLKAGQAGSHALRSYQYCNSSTELAEDIADAWDAAWDKFTAVIAQARAAAPSLREAEARLELEEVQAIWEFYNSDPSVGSLAFENFLKARITALRKEAGK